MAIRGRKNSVSDLMNKQAKNEKKQALKKKTEELEAVVESTADKEPKTAKEIKPAKSNKLTFFRQYYTYQAFLELHPEGDFSADECFTKAILYIMKWFRDRMGEEVYVAYPDTVYLKDDYPEPDDYKNFELDKVGNIYGFSFIDFEAAFIDDKNTWIARLIEPDNGVEKVDIHDRTFTTEIFVSKLQDSVALGIREGCREPETNVKDASGFRPGFVRTMSLDPNIMITEFGIDRKYAFLKKPFILNGKSGKECDGLYSNLIVSENRQMPVLFVPGDYYKEHIEEIDGVTRSLLGHAHVVVWEETCGKLFGQTMQSDELAEVANAGQIIFYRTTNKNTYLPDYYQPEAEEVLKEIKERAQKESIRKNIDFKRFVFKPSWWDINKVNNQDAVTEDVADKINAYEKMVAELQKDCDDLRNDNEGLQRKNEELKKQNGELKKENAKQAGVTNKLNEDINDRDSEINGLKEMNQRLKAEAIWNQHVYEGLRSSEKDRYRPIINLPLFPKDIKNDIINWVEEYYSDVIVLHQDAIKSLKDEKRNIDWRQLCMMIHYLAGYTRYRNEGGAALDAHAAREYDPEDANYKVTPAGSGKGGATSMCKDEYTINYAGKNVTMELHIKYGKGRDADMIRIYFYYDPEEKKSVIGYMPGHLGTRKSSH